jgi:aquaporin Z
MGYRRFEASTLDVCRPAAAPPIEGLPMRDSTASPSTSATLVAEAFGTFLLVLAIVGTALFASGFGAGTEQSVLAVGFTGVALAAGFAVLVGVYAFGPLSGGHFNPAVTLGLAAAGRFPWNRTVGYVLAQIAGGAVATTLIVLIGLFGPDRWLSVAQDGGFASNGWGNLSPAGFGLGGAIIVEFVFTALFVVVILGVTHPERGDRRIAGIAIGLTLTVIHLATIPVDGTSVNPARSIATAIYGGPEALAHLWVFLVFPIAGAMLAGAAYRALFDTTTPPVDASAS